MVWTITVIYEQERTCHYSLVKARRNQTIIFFSSVAVVLWSFARHYLTEGFIKKEILIIVRVATSSAIKPYCSS